jgi:hypothetical protein
MCSAKDLAPTRTAVTILRALSGSPYDAADALHALAPETKAPGREIAADEVRYALSALSADRIMPEASPTVSKVVHALLTAVKPLTQAALADRADVSSRSLRTHCEVLEAFDLVRATDNGGLRFALPFRSERADRNRGTAVLPFYAAENPDRDGLIRGSDVLFEVVGRLVEDLGRLADPDDPIGGVFFDSGRFAPGQLADSDAWPWFAPWLSVVGTLLDVDGDRDRSSPPVIMGTDPDQLAIQQASASTTSGAATAGTH